jgi:hypothetical protein
MRSPTAWAGSGGGTGRVPLGADGPTWMGAGVFRGRTPDLKRHSADYDPDERFFKSAVLADILALYHPSRLSPSARQGQMCICRVRIAEGNENPSRGAERIAAAGPDYVY